MGYHIESLFDLPLLTVVTEGDVPITDYVQSMEVICLVAEKLVIDVLDRQYSHGDETAIECSLGVVFDCMLILLGL